MPDPFHPTDSAHWAEEFYAPPTAFPTSLTLQQNSLERCEGKRWRAKRFTDRHGDATVYGYGNTKDEATVQLLAKIVPLGQLHYEAAAHF